MTEIVKVFRDEVPAMRFIGKKYPGFGPWWGDWFANGWFDEIERAMGGTEAILGIWENGGGYVGLEKRKDGELAAYWIGMFAPPDTPIPEGFESFEVPAGAFATCWIRGPEDEVHGAIPGCEKAVRAAGLILQPDADGYVVCFENGLCPRFTTPDADGNVILDYCFLAE